MNGNNQFQITICEMKRKNIVLFIYDYVRCALQLIWVMRCRHHHRIVSIRFGARSTQSKEECKILRLHNPKWNIHAIYRTHAYEHKFNSHSHSIGCEDNIEWRTSKNFHMCEILLCAEFNSSMKTYVKKNRIKTLRHRHRWADFAGTTTSE